MSEFKTHDMHPFALPVADGIVSGGRFKIGIGKELKIPFVGVSSARRDSREINLESGG
jgi:hypothetical protein